MSFYKFVEIVCDECEEAADTFDTTATQARAHLHVLGWRLVVQNGILRDICPECYLQICKKSDKVRS